MSFKHLNLKSLSYNGAYYITKVQNESHAKRYMYYYSLQILIGSFVEFAAILLAALALGLFKETIVCLMTFASIRFFAGGYHASTYLQCFIDSLLIIVGVAAFSKFASNYYSVFISLILFAVVLIITYKAAPYVTTSKPITSEKQKQSLKFKALTISIIWLAISIYFFAVQKKSISTAITFAAFVEALTLTPAVVRTLSLFEKSVQKYFAR